jgi:hypothetical protein
MSTAEADQGRRYLRALAEIGAITLGVFLGLAADAAWDSRQERARERDYLVALHNRTAPDDSVGAWALEARRVAVFYPPSAVFDDLVSSGSLRLIQSSEIRRALAEYEQNRPRLRFLEDREQIFIENELRPYLVRAISFDGPQTPTGIARLLADPAFRNLVEIRRFRIQATLDYAVLVGGAIDRSIRLIESRLQRGAAP